MTKPAPLPAEWMQHLGSEFEQPYIQALRAFLLARKQAGAVVYPPSERWFQAFWQTPLSQVRVILLGQDPYHGPGQAEGLSFSVPRGVDVPPSLRNMMQELHTDLGCVPVAHGCLHHWANQGVLLLNTVLTVEQAQAGSHRQQGWEVFTDQVIRVINQQAFPSVFLLWGSAARSKRSLIDTQRHCVLEAPHPSPLSSYRGFFGCRHFSKANQWLEQQGRGTIDWQLPA